MWNYVQISFVTVKYDRAVQSKTSGVFDRLSTSGAVKYVTMTQWGPTIRNVSML